MTTAAAVVATDPIYVRWLQNAAGRDLELHSLAGGESAAVMDQLRRIATPEVLFVEVSDAEPRGELLDLAAREWPQLPLIALGSECSSELVIRTMRAGALDFLVYGRDDRELPTRLRKLLNRNSGTQTSAPARIIAMLNAVPDPGLSWAGLHLAIASLDGTRSEERVLLLDAATPHGASLVFLNSGQNYSLLDGLRDLDRCDRTLVDTAFSRHSSGLYLLSLPEDLIGAAPLEAAELLELLEVLSRVFHRVVVTAGTNLPVAALSGLLRKAHGGVILSGSTIINSRANKHLLRQLRLDGARFERCGLVVDQSGGGGLQADSLAEVLELPLWGVLGGSYAQRIGAMDAGEPLFARAPRDGYCAAIRQLAARLDTADPAAATAPLLRRPGLLAGLLGR